MQNELDPKLGIQLIAVNSPGSPGGVDSVTEGRDIPYLQDMGKVDAHGLWGANQRDVYVLDKDGVLVGVWSLDRVSDGGYDLGEEKNYEMLKAVLEAEAMK